MLETGVKVVLKEALLNIIQVHGPHYLNPEPLLQTNTHIGLFDVDVKEKILKNEPMESITDNDACYVYDSFVSFLKNNSVSRFGLLGTLFLNVKRTILPTLELLREEDTDRHFVPVVGRRIFDVIAHQWMLEDEDLQYKRKELENKSK